MVMFAGLYAMQENCYPSIMSQLFLSQGIRVPELEDYCRDRDAVLTDVASTLGVSRDIAKKCFLTVCHIGNYTQHTAGVKLAFLDSFNTNYISAVKLLATRQPFALVWASVQRKEDRKNPLGTFVSWNCQRHEAAAINALTSFFEGRGGTVRTNSFDGLMVEGFHHLDKPALADLLTSVQPE
jgi:hypothetical protein